MGEPILAIAPIRRRTDAEHTRADGITGFLADAPTVTSLANSLERLWARRALIEEIGRAGAKKIRELVPPDPARVFTEKLKKLVH